MAIEKSKSKEKTKEEATPNYNQMLDLATYHKSCPGTLIKSKEKGSKKVPSESIVSGRSLQEKYKNRMEKVDELNGFETMKMESDFISGTLHSKSPSKRSKHRSSQLSDI